MATICCEMKDGRLFAESVHPLVARGVLRQMKLEYPSLRWWLVMS